MTDSQHDPCSRFEASLVEALEGALPEELLRHLEECDRCRDLRHDAMQVADLLRDAGADYRHPEAFEEELLRRLAAAPAAPDLATRTLSSVASAEEGPRTARLAQRSAVSGGSDVPTAAAPGATVELPPLPAPSRPQQAARSGDTVELAPLAAPRGPTGDGEPSSPSATAAGGVGFTGGPTPSAERSGTVVEQADAGGGRGGPAHEARRSPVSGWRRGALLGGLAAAAAVAFLALRPGAPTTVPGPNVASGRGAWGALVASVEGGGDVTGCQEGRCAPLAAGAKLDPGAEVRVQGAARVFLDLADGSSLALERGTRVTLAKEGRGARLEAGAVVADVRRQAGAPPARIEVPHGVVEVLGTRLSVQADPRGGSVDVSRGSVRLADGAGRSVVVGPGESGRVEEGRPPSVGRAAALAERFAWSERESAEEREPLSQRGLGELRAKKPGAQAEQAGAVTLSLHKVKVRASGSVVRTEVEEVFTNHTDDVLEGIYRFPLPADAAIDRLALEVDGKLEEGAFVERDRAAAIWRGAITTAAPKLRRQVMEEIVWVPGPWKDPALLEWQRGGRFELRIYPIPKRGSRRIVLGYTQVVEPSAGVRRFVYPLAHDPGGSTRVDRFEIDAQVRGHDTAAGVRVQGYPLEATSTGEAEELRFSTSAFTPAGDLVLEWTLPDRDAELTAWTYQQDAGATESKPPGAPGAAAAVPDSAPYVALALRPRLPRPEAPRPRSVALVVDSSRSLFGEGFRHATRLAARFARELSEDDRVTLLTCDTRCRVWEAGAIPGGEGARQEVERVLGGLVPEGASDPTAALGEARRVLAGERERDLHVVLIGDGLPTAGPIRPASVERGARAALAGSPIRVTALGVGVDADRETLAALARAGGGLALTWPPGRTTAEMALELVGALAGTALTDVSVELPPGLTQVAPQRLDALPAGGEAVVTARLERPLGVAEVRLTGKVGGKAFEQRYSVDLSVRPGGGNAFVPRLWAKARIAELEREGSAEARAEAIRLSGRFDVASVHTSLLVLESPAMFRAFGLDNRRDAPEWSGEEATAQATAAGELDVGAPEAERGMPTNPYGGGGGEAPGLGSLGSRFDSDGESKRKGSAAEEAPARLRHAEGPPPAAASPVPAAKPAMPLATSPAPPPPAADSRWEPPAPRRRLVPMRRVWERKGSVVTDRLIPRAASFTAIAEAEAARARDENRRDATRRLWTLLSLAGDLERAAPLCERWSEKEPLDPEALTARADLAARSGDRELAIRILGSVVDVRPGDVKAQQRLARLHRWAGAPELGCRHAQAVAELHPRDGTLLADAVECLRRTGGTDAAESLLRDADPAARKAAETRLAKPPADPNALSGDFRVEATWSGDADLDLALLHPAGHRVSWLGAPTRGVITARDVTARGREALALRGAETGDYVVEIVRGDGSTGTVTGQVTVSVAGATRTVPFTLTGSRVTVALATIRMESRLVPAGW